MLFRKDRAGCRGGRVIIGVKSRYHPSRISISSPLEIVCVSCYFEHVHCVIGACYRPPDSRQDFVEILNNSIDTIVLKFPSCVLILAGDFNYPDIDWASLTVHAQCNRHEQLSFLRLLHYQNLKQLVHEPTRGDHILDLVLTNNPQLVKQTYWTKSVTITPYIAHCCYHVPTNLKLRNVSLTTAEPTLKN